MNVKEEVQATNFFPRVNNAKHGAFKMEMLSWWASNAMTPSKTPNEIHRLAGSWVKQPTCTEGGEYAITYLTIEEEAKIRTKKQSEKKSRKEKQSAT